jgi:hypothetical protein
VTCTTRSHHPHPLAVPAGLEAKIMEEHIGDDSWGELNSTEWRGLGLTDPIKKVEVSDSKMC